MKISMKTDYALRVLFDLIKSSKDGPVSARELAARNAVPLKFLERIMSELKQQGWIVSSAGKHGGYRLEVDPAKITIGEVVRHFDGMLAPINCVSVTCYERCSQEPVCTFRRLFLEIRNETARRMDSATMASLASAPQTRFAEVFDPQFIYGDGI